MENKKVTLEDNEYFDVEQSIKKIAKENNITNVASVEVEITPTKGVIKFKKAEESNDTSQENKV
jgi:hypothetical protein